LERTWISEELYWREGRFSITFVGEKDDYLKISFVAEKVD